MVVGEDVPIGAHNNSGANALFGNIFMEFLENFIESSADAHFLFTDDGHDRRCDVQGNLGKRFFRQIHRC